MRLLSYIFSIGLLALCSGRLHAITFVGGFEGNIWTDYRNWEPQQVPGAGDQAEIPQNTGVTINGAISVGSLILEGGLNSDGNPGSSLTIVSDFSWTSGTINVPVFINQGAGGLWQGGLWIGADVTNYGEITCDASITFDYHSLINYGTFNLSGQHQFGVYHSPTSFENYGLLRKLIIDPSTFSIGFSLINHPGGNISVENGELYASIHCQQYGDVEVSAGASFHTHTLQIYDNATFSGNGLLNITGNGAEANNTSPLAIDIAEVRLNANGIGGSGLLTFNHHFVFESGSIGTKITWASTAVVDINVGGAGITTECSNYGTFNINSQLTFSYGSLLNYGTIVLTGPYGIGIYAAGPGVYNHGTVTKPITSAGTFNFNFPLYNESDGTLLVYGGVLSIGSDLYNKGSITVGLDATLKVDNTHTYNGGTFSGPGIYKIFYNGLFAHNTDPVVMDVAEVDISSSVSGSGPITFTGHVIWTAGSFSAEVTLASSCVTDLNGGGGVADRTTTNYGTLNVNSGYTLSAGQIKNYGLMSLNGPYQIYIYYGTPGVFNYGTVKKTAGDNGVYAFNVPLTNYAGAQVIVEEGTLSVGGDFYQYGSLTVAAGAVFKANATHVYDGASFNGAGTYYITYNGLYNHADGNVNFDIAETVWESSLNSQGNGSLTFTQHLNWTNGGIGGGMTLIIAAGAVLDINPSGYHSIGDTLINNGTINANAGFGNGVLLNNGTLNIAPDLSFGDGNLFNNGIMTNNAGGSMTTSYFIYNSGSIDVTEGLFTMNYGLFNAGAINVAAGAETVLDGYNSNNSFEAGSSINGAGIFTLLANCAVNGNVNVDIQQFNLSSPYYGLSGTGTLTYAHLFNWDSGQIECTLHVQASNTLDISGPGGKYLLGTLLNDGMVNDNSDLYAGYNTLITNNGIFNLNGDNTLGSTYGYQGQFDNAGTLNKTSSGTLRLGMFLNNLSGAQVSVQNGVMSTGKLDNAGNLDVASGATLTVKDGSNLIGGTLSGAGLLRIEDNGWYLSSTLTVSGLTLEIAAYLRGDNGATLEVQSHANWLGGEIAIPLNIQTGGVMDIQEGYYLQLSTALTNAGTLNAYGSVNAGADVSNSGNMNFYGSYSGFFGFGNFNLNNTGTINASASSYNYLYLHTINSGAIQVNSGTAYCNAGLENSGSVGIAAGAELYLASTSSFNTGSSVTGAGRITNTGELTLAENLAYSGEMFTLNGGALYGPGDLNVSAGMTWQYGDIETDVHVDAGATLAIGYGGGGGGGNNSKQAANKVALHPSNSGMTLYATLTNDGTATQSSNFYMDGGVFNNNGTMETDYAGIYRDNGGAGTFTNNGSWTLNSSFNTDVDVVNNGTLTGNEQASFTPDLVNNGVVEPGPNVRSFQIAQNFSNGTQLNIEIQDNSGPGQGHDYLEAANTMQLSGDLQVTETGAPLNAQFEILHCNGGPGCMNGTFSNTVLPADYTLTYTDQSVILNKGIPAQVSPADTTICSGSSVTLTASSGDAYAWSTGETTQSIEVFPYNNTTYQVTVTQGSGGAVGQATVNVMQAPYLYVSPSYAYLCQGESVTLTAYGDYDVQYAWSTGETSESITVSPDSAVTYLVTLTNASGCSTEGSAYVEGTNNPPSTPEISNIPDSVCQSEPAFYLDTYQNGYYGYWTGPGAYYGYYFDPAGLSGPQELTFSPYSGQCALPVNWTIVVQNATWYADADGDGYGDASNSVSDCAQPAGFVADNTDCNDANANVHPGATEICNNIDDNCDGQIDEGGQNTYYADADGDGYGDAANSIVACTAPTGYVSDQSDCNDANASIHPGATEVCNNADDDCDGQIDEDINVTWYRDADGDGFGNIAMAQTSCTQPQGYVADNSDCDDTRAYVHPGASEICNGRDDDCDGQIDEGLQSTFYADADGDGYGNPNVTMQSCGPDEGFVSNNQDCDDTNPDIHPGAAEICDGIDNNCNGLIDNDDPGVSGQPTWFADADGDGYGNASVTQLSCTQPSGYVNNNTDCDDSNADVHPGATEACNNLDDNCDGQIDEGVQHTYYADNDGDGFGDINTSIPGCSAPAGYVSDHSDCNDFNASIHPGATETCNNIDDDCDGLIDQGVGIIWYADADGDGFGSASGTTIACTQPAGYVSNANDCDDSNPAVHPGAQEICNGIDDDCDGLTDETNLNVNLAAGTIRCNGGLAQLTVTATGGVGPYQYSLDGGPFVTSNTFTIAAGDHYVTVRDVNTCSGTNTIQVGEPAAIVIDPILVTNVTCGGGNTGAVDITVSGGAGSFHYHWSNNRTTQDLINVAGNTYTVTVTDVNGCSQSASATVNPKLKLVLSKTNTACNGGSDGTATASATGGTPNYTYAWSNGQTTATITGLSVGTYSVTVQDALGCTRNAQISIGQPAAIGISGVVTKAGCYGSATGAINISLSNGVAPFQFSWNDGATTEDRTALTAGSYTVLVTDVNGCTREKSFSITQPTALTLGFQVSDATCNGDADGEITANVGGGTKFPTSNLCNGERYCFSWSNGDNARTTSGLTAGAYTVSVTDANGCVISGQATVNEPTAIEITDVQVTPLANGKYKVTVSADGGVSPYKYKRIPGGGFQSSNVFNNVPAGTYTIVVRDKNICETSSTVTVGASNRPGSSQERESDEMLITGDDNDLPVSVYPNPVSDRFEVNIEKAFESARITIFNGQGVSISTQNLDADQQPEPFEVGSWKPGMYFVRVEIDQERYVKKILVLKR